MAPPDPPARGAHDWREETSDAFDGSPTWRVVRTMRDGTPFTIRGIQPEDREELARGFRAASAETRYLRFLGAVAELSDKALTYLTEVDQKNHIALVATLTSPDLKTERGVGVGRLIRLGSSDVAEAAITVADDTQRRGVGVALALELVAAGRLHGIRTIRADVLEANTPMRAILEEAGARRVDSRAAPGVLSYDIELERVMSLPSRIIDLLRGAAETMAVSIRRLVPPEDGEK